MRIVFMFDKSQGVALRQPGSCSFTCRNTANPPVPQSASWTGFTTTGLSSHGPPPTGGAINGIFQGTLVGTSLVYGSSIIAPPMTFNNNAISSGDFIDIEYRGNRLITSAVNNGWQGSEPGGGADPALCDISYNLYSSCGGIAPVPPATIPTNLSLITIATS